jgi:hypothetical protein
MIGKQIPEGKKDFGKKGVQEPRWKWLFLFVGGAMMFVIVVILVVAAISRFSDRIADAKKRTAPVEARIPLCTGGKYDFSSVIVPGEVKADFRPDCISEVILPPAVVFRTDPSSDIKIVFIDGSQYIDGPGRQVWYGLKRGIFKIRGLKEAGVLKITLEKKT